VQRWLSNFYQSLDSLLSHKNIFVDHSSSKNTYKKYRNNKINNKRRKSC